MRLIPLLLALTLSACATVSDRARDQLDAPDCVRDCLSDLANAVAMNGITKVDQVIADETLYTREPWPPGWPQDDLVTRSGAPVSALTVNSNEFGLIITPGDAVGDPARIVWRGGPNLARFFERHGQTLPLPQDATDYLPGDIITVNPQHIALIPDRRVRGRTNQLVILQNPGFGVREDLQDFAPVTGHFRYQL